MGADRLQRPLEYEARLWSRGLSAIAGVDEAGRGPLAGPVVAAAVILPPDTFVDGVRDSKTLSASARESLLPEIWARARAAAIGAASVSEIDRNNILVATRMAIARALANLPMSPEHVVIDGLPVKGLEWAHDAVIGGDARVHSIACASVLAKVTRDRLMRRLAARYPGYGWETNVGYGTPAHRDAIRRLGPTPHHRLTFGDLQMELGLK